jgi:hypothetical protein
MEKRLSVDVWNLVPKKLAFRHLGTGYLKKGTYLVQTNPSVQPYKLLIWAT